MVSALTTPKNHAIFRTSESTDINGESKMTNTTQNALCPQNLVAAAALTRGGQFAYLSMHRTKTGDLADRLFQVGFSYQNLLERALEDINALTPGDVVAKCHHCESVELAEKAIAQQKASWEKSLTREQEGETDSDYTWIGPGVGLNANNPDRVYVRGLQVDVRYHERVEKKTQSRKLTLVKAWIRRQSRVSDYRMMSFTISPANFDALSMGGQTLTPADFAKMVVVAP
tara:strand:- start:7019 stop:7705 length:687 start_codon:yes stop_codon:yes gene_type:complete